MKIILNYLILNNFLEGGINSPIKRLLSQHRGMKYEHQIQLVELYLFKQCKLYNLVKIGDHFRVMLQKVSKISEV